MFLNKKIIFFVLLIVLAANVVNAADSNITIDTLSNDNEDNFVEMKLNEVDDNNLNELSDNEINLNQTDSESLYSNSISNLNDNSGDYSFLSNDVIMYYKNGTKYQVKLIDKFDNPIANHMLNLTINGHVYQKITDNKGFASLNLNLNPGIYEIVVKNNNLGIQTYNFIKILPTIKGQDIVKYFNNGTQYYVSLVNGRGNFLSNKNILMNINGISYNKTTDNSGKAKLNINLNPGEYIITVTDPNNGLLMSNKISILAKLKGENINMTYKDGTSYEIRLVNENGKSIQNRIVKMNINGVFYYKTTNSNGIAKLNINLNAGKYIITSTCDDSNINSWSDTIKINSIPPNYNIFYNVSLPLTFDRTVKININNKFFNFTTAGTLGYGDEYYINNNKLYFISLYNPQLTSISSISNINKCGFVLLKTNNH